MDSGRNLPSDDEGSRILFTVTAPITNKGDYADGEFAAIFFNRAEQMVGNSPCRNQFYICRCKCIRIHPNFLFQDVA